MTATVVTFVRDLLFGSKIDGVLASVGFTAAKIRSTADAEQLLASSAVSAAVLNLQIPGDDVYAVAKLFLSRNIPVFAFYPHVEPALRDRAVACGISEVHPRAAILKVLERKLGAVSTGAAP